jgi:hypothetical protein
MARFAALYFSARNIPPNGSAIIVGRVGGVHARYEQATGGRDVLRPK